MDKERKRHRSLPQNQQHLPAKETVTAEPMNIDMEGDEGVEVGAMSFAGSVSSINCSSTFQYPSDDDDEGMDSATPDEPNADQDSSNTSPKPTDSAQIFYIDTNKVDERLKLKTGDKLITNIERIEFMIEDFNKDHKSANIEDSEDENQYKEKTFKLIFDAKSPFKLEFFSRKLFHEDVETGEKTSTLSKIRFLHRENKTEPFQTESQSRLMTQPEIFAIPNASGHTVVSRWSDSKFPLSIASAVLQEHSTYKKTVKNLFGNRHLVTYKMKQKEALDQSEGNLRINFSPQICTYFRAVVEYPNVKHLLGYGRVGELKLDVFTNRSIQFNCRIKEGINKYSELCDLLSDIHNDPLLPRSPEYDQPMLKEVKKEMVTNLDKILIKKIADQFNPLKASQDSEIDDWIVCQKNFEEYFEANRFHLFKSKEEIRNFDHAPSLQELCSIMKKIDRGKNIETFLKSFKIAITQKAEEKPGRTQNFLSCVEAFIYYEVQQKSFWRVGGKWYEISMDYEFQVHQNFWKLLDQHFLDWPNHSVNTPWPRKTEIQMPSQSPTAAEKQKFKLYKEDPLIREGSYLQDNYGTKENFLVCDGSFDYNGIEICDLLQFRPENTNTGESTIWLYHVKKYFKAESTSIVTAQIMNSVSLLEAAWNSGPQSENSALYALYQWAIHREENNFVKNFKDFQEFRKEFRNPTFVHAIGQKNECSLQLEKNLKWKFDWNEFHIKIESSLGEKKFSSLKYKDKVLYESLETEILIWLDGNNFIDSAKSFTPTWYFWCGKKDGLNSKDLKFSSPWPNKGVLPRDKIHRFLKEMYYTKLDSLASKIQVLITAEFLGTKNFRYKICEIESGDEQT